MKIAIISSNTLPTPPENIEIPEGWTTSIHNLTSSITEGLVEKGHDVTLYASGNSKTKAKLVSVWEKSSSELQKLDNQFGYFSFDSILISKCFEDNKTENFDIIYAYHTFDSAIFANLIDTPIVSTYHGSAREDYLKVWANKIIKPNQIVGISNYQIESMPYIPFTEKISHGIDGDNFKLNENGGEGLVLVGRISTDKGTDIAVDIAKELDKGLSVFGTTNYQPLMDELNEKAKNGKIKFEGQRSQSDIRDKVSKSKAFIFPARWEEPFGLVLIESLATGTPIVAFANGSLPEIVEDGVTGFFVNMDEEHIRGDFIVKKTGIEGLKEALTKIYSMDENEYKQMRLNCRKSFEKRFTKQIMVDNYENLFKKIINRNV